VGGVPEPTAPPSVATPIGLSDLATRMRAEWRSDEEMWTTVAARQWAHGRRITDLVREYAARGDRVALDVAGRTFEGDVCAVGDDRLDLETASSAVTVHLAVSDARPAVLLPIAVRRVSRARSGGTRLPAALATFRARLHELEGTGERVRVGVLFPPGELVGAIVVGADHVVVGASTEVVVPTAWIAYVAAVSDDGR